MKVGIELNLKETVETQDKSLIVAGKSVCNVDQQRPQRS